MYLKVQLGSCADDVKVKAGTDPTSASSYLNPTTRAPYYNLQDFIIIILIVIVCLLIALNVVLFLKTGKLKDKVEKLRSTTKSLEKSAKKVEKTPKMK